MHRVACENLFGRIDLALILATHCEHVAPAMLEYAVESVLRGC